MLSLFSGAGRRTPIGLDIGATAIRAVQLRRSGDRFTLAAAGQSDQSSTVPTESKERLSEGLRSALRQASFSGRVVVSALNPPDIEYHMLDLPAAAMHAQEREARQMVHWEIGRLTSESPDKVETRHWALPPSPGSTPNAIGVSAGREAVTRLVEACGAAGTVCAGVDTCATALGRFGQLLTPWPDDCVWGVLDVGARQSRLVLCLGETPILVRHTGSGGQEWTQRIADGLQLSAGAAETQKRTHGIVHTGRAAGSGVRGSADEAGVRGGNADDPLRSEVGSLLLGALRSDLNELAAEVKRSYEYVLSCYPGRRAGDLVLVGGGAGLRNLPEYLAGALGIDVRRASSFLSEPQCRLSYGTDGRHPLECFAAAVGLAAS